MHFCRLFVVVAAFVSVGRAMAYSIPLYTDVSVALSAYPIRELSTGDLVTFTVTVKNNGPTPAGYFAFIGPDIYEELYQPTFQWTDCILTVTGDSANGPFWSPEYYPGGLVGQYPMAVGETRTCQFTLGVGATFPQSYFLRCHCRMLSPTLNRAMIRLSFNSRVSFRRSLCRAPERSCYSASLLR
jgi:hypothetical protein